MCSPKLRRLRRAAPITASRPASSTIGSVETTKTTIAEGQEPVAGTTAGPMTMPATNAIAANATRAVVHRPEAKNSLILFGFLKLIWLSLDVLRVPVNKRC